MGKSLTKLLKLEKVWENLTKAEIMYGNVLSNINETHAGFTITFADDEQQRLLAPKIPFGSISVVTISKLQLSPLWK